MRTSFFIRLVGQHISNRDGGFLLSFKHASRNANGHAVGRNIREDHCVGPNAHIVSDMNWTQDFGAGANVNAVSQNRRTAATRMLQSHGYPVANHAIVSKDRVTTDDDSSEMIDSEPPPKRGCLAGKLTMPVSISERTFKTL